MADPQERIARLEAELREAQADRDLFRSLIDHQTDLIAKTDLDGRLLYVSPSYCDLFGRTKADLLGQCYLPTVHEEDRAATLQAMQTLRTAPYSSYNEARSLTRHGWRWLAWSNSAVHGPAGELCAVIAVGRDITERKRMQQELADQVRLFNTMLESLPVGIFMVQAPDGTPLIANRLAEELLGRGILVQAGSANIGEIYRAFRAGTDQPYPPERMPILRGMDGERLHIDDMEVERPDGTRRRLEVFGSPVADAQGRTWASLVGFFDITERKRAEAEAQRLQQKIQQTQKLESLGVLAGGIAHDFNNILMAILGHAELAQRKISALSPGREHLRGIEMAAGRAADLCREMLAYAGKATFACEPLHVGDLVEEMAHLLKASISKKAILNLHCERGLPRILADPSQIRQILLNLIINASDAIGERSGVINIALGATRCDQDYLSKTELAGTLPPGLYVQIEVSDTGCGMTPETRTRIFEPFFTTKFAGRGLGLAAALGIVKAHSGALKVYSEPGRGSTFKLLFPAIASETADPSPHATDLAWRGRGTVLLADDEESLRALCAEMLESLGLTVLTAEDGRQAVELFRAREDITLVILDLTMPHMDGVEAFRALRQIRPEVKVVLASGYPQEDVAARFAGKGLAGVLQKPYTIAKLSQVLAQALG